MWENDEVQFARLLCELVAADYNVTDAAKSMDLDVKDINELLDRAHEVFEKAKVAGAAFNEPYEIEATQADSRYWMGIPVYAVDVGLLHNKDGLSIQIWKREDDGYHHKEALCDWWWTWDDIGVG